MKKCAAIASTVVVLAGALWVASAGDLEPPGPPAPTMKTLDDVEPSVPIHPSDLPVTITAPGRYRLVGDADVPSVSTAITIATSNVTLDLAGFSLRNGFGDGIRASSTVENIEILNGTVEGWKDSGIDLGQASNVAIRHVRSIGNGDWGILVGNHAVVRDCHVAGNGFGGYSAGGIGVRDNAVVAHNVCQGNLWGIELDGSGSRVDENHLYQNDEGIVDFTTGGGNVVIRNSVGASYVDNYNIAPGNDVGPIGTASTSTSPWANIEF